jgi:hypothetical protein
LRRIHNPEGEILAVQVRSPRQDPALAEHRATGDLAQGGTHTAAAAAYPALAEHRARSNPHSAGRTQEPSTAIKAHQPPFPSAKTLTINFQTQ